MKTYLFSILFAASAAAAPLPPLTIEPGSVTVSGLSSGAFMAEQLQVAFSSRIHGTASLAGGIYACAEGSVLNAQMRCMLFPAQLAVPDFVELAKQEEERGAIDPLANLKNARFYLLHSRADATVRFDALEKLEAFVKTFTPASRVKTVVLDKAAHAFPTKGYGEPCDTTGSPFLVNCDRDVAGEILEQLYPGLRAPAEKPTGDFVAFDQEKYSESRAALLKEGYLYVPKACRTGNCRLHIALHGCKMSTDFTKAEFRENAGYNRWADTNRIVVLYPNAAKTLTNPNGCWDWFGITSVTYATKEGPQMQFFSRVLDHFKIKE